MGNFNLFDDTSNLEYAGYVISLNMVAKSCIASGEVGVGLDHVADPYIPQ